MSLYSLDLHKLIGGPRDSLVFNTRLMHNGRSFSISALGDIGADGYVFLNQELSVLLGKRFGLKAESIGQECPVRGFDGKLSKPITYVNFLTMCVDGRVQQ